MNETMMTKAAGARATWQAADSEAKGLREKASSLRSLLEQQRRAGYSAAAEARVELLELDANALEAEDEAAFRRALATAAQDAADIAAGDELAIACSPAHLRADLMKFNTEASELRAMLADVEQRENARAALAESERPKLVARRSSEGLAPPTALPRAGAMLFGPTLLEALDQKLAIGVVREDRNAEKIRRLRREERELRLQLERARIERERQEADRVARRKQDAEEHAARAAAWALENATAEKAARAKREEEDRLVAAHRARTAAPRTHA